MAEYIDRNELELDAEWSEYHDGFTAYSQGQIQCAPTIDVIERSKIDKAMSEIKALAPTPTKIDVEEGNPILNAVYETIYNVLEIIKRNIGE